MAIRVVMEAGEATFRTALHAKPGEWDLVPRQRGAIAKVWSGEFALGLQVRKSLLRCMWGTSELRRQQTAAWGPEVAPGLVW